MLRAVRHVVFQLTFPFSFDPASLLILQKLNEVLTKLDEDRHQWSSRANGDLHVPERDQRDHVPAMSENTETESILDAYKVQTSYTSADTVLSWPVFGSRCFQNCLSDELFVAEYSVLEASETVHRTSYHEEEIPDLVDQFLRHVHIKNPILDPKQLRADARKLTEYGVRWDGTSCVVVRPLTHLCMT